MAWDETEDDRIRRVEEVLERLYAVRDAQVLADLAAADVEEAGSFAWPGGPIRPLYWHPWYRDKAHLLDWLESADRTRLVPLPPAMEFDETAVDVADTPPHLTLHKTRAAAFAPYVGEPYMYTWWVATDEYGRSIASDSRRVNRTGRPH